MEKDKAQPYDLTDHYGSLNKEKYIKRGMSGMNEVGRCTQELVKAICNSQEYREFEEIKKKVRENPGLQEEIDRFRRKNFELQNKMESDDLYADLDEFQRESEGLRSNPLVDEYLSSELAICRMIQRVNQAIMTTVNLDIDNFADRIDW
jgi:cell fate (sporulation/competence/biofilm development) regulator YlbF (YheA/YmcA/DUF963 family)